MKTSHLLEIGGVILFIAFSDPCSICFAQGSLTPPGAPGATMLTLSQIEPRTPITSLPFNITRPGSYFLTTNLFGVSGTNGITITTSNVVIDLRGFTLNGVPGAGDGIFVDAAIQDLLGNIFVRNGIISGWPANGVDADNSINSQFSDLNVVNNGQNGLNSGQQAIIRNCVAAYNGLEGYGGDLNTFCDWEACDAHDNGDCGFYTGSYCTFKDCHGNNNASAGFNPFLSCTFQDCIADDNYWGVYGYNGDMFVRCQFAYNGGSGLLGQDNCVVRDTVASNNGDDGISVGNGCALIGCSASTNATDNIATMSGCTLSQCAAWNSVAGNGFTLGAGNTITACSALGNATNGIDAGQRTTVQSCNANFNANAGIHASYLSNVQQCSCFNNGVYGILSDGNGYSSLINNNCSYNGVLADSGPPDQGAGIFITNSPGCRIEGNTLDYNYAALLVAPNNQALIIRNSADANVYTSYSLGTGNSWGPIVNVSAGGDISTIANSSHPDANFIH
ncbi:MAG: right-handed parallel beta-helix repeat-containing protein [Limisphaerales bacterium]